MWTTLLLSTLASSLLSHASSLLAQGSIMVPARKPIFLSKFCFDSGAGTGSLSPGHFHIELPEVSPKTGTFELALFDDQGDSYPDETSMQDWECGSEQLNQAAKFRRTIHASELAWKTTMPLEERLRPRWWYVAVIDCSGVERKLEYKLHFTNPQQGWQQEFSMDQCGLVSLCFFFVVYTASALAQFLAISSNSETAHTKHPVRLMLFIALASAAVGMLAFVVGGFFFSRHGESSASLHLAAKSLKAVSKLALASILLLMSQGSCISRQFHHMDLWRMLRALVPFFGACLSLELWGEYAQSRTYTTGFVYCTWFGAALVLGDLCLLGLYLKSLRASYLSELDVDRLHFYKFWGGLYSCSFIALPFAAILSTILSPWVRAETMFLLTNGVHATMLALLVIGLWPESAQTAFCIDDAGLANTIGIKADFLKIDGIDESPCLLKTRTPNFINALQNGVDCYISANREASRQCEQGKEYLNPEKEDSLP